MSAKPDAPAPRTARLARGTIQDAFSGLRTLVSRHLEAATGMEVFDALAVLADDVAKLEEAPGFVALQRHAAREAGAAMGAPVLPARAASAPATDFPGFDQGQMADMVRACEVAQQTQGTTFAGPGFARGGPPVPRVTVPAEWLLRLLHGPKPAEAFVPTHQHVQRETSYEVLALGTLQTAAPLADGAQLLTYRDAEGRLWHRTPAEFSDGRFRALGDAGGLPAKPTNTRRGRAWWWSLPTVMLDARQFRQSVLEAAARRIRAIPGRVEPGAAMMRADALEALNLPLDLLNPPPATCTAPGPFAVQRQAAADHAGAGGVRPRECREALRSAGQHYPKSGCAVCGSVLLGGCPYGNIPSEGEK